ncbi:hypothetical protein FB446DRAFT_795198 [Lentinula raphanica]|nr:hypothetical protein FB446DRAFT_795198 [Lentinula raphanica]
MGNKKNAQHRMRSKSKLSESQQNNLRAGRIASAAKRKEVAQNQHILLKAAEKENSNSLPAIVLPAIVPLHLDHMVSSTPPIHHTAVSKAPSKTSTLARKLDSAKRQIRRLKRGNSQLKNELQSVKDSLKREKKLGLESQKQIDKLQEDFKTERSSLLDLRADMKRMGYLRTRLERALLLAKNQQKLHGTMTQQLRHRGRGGAYSNKACELAREMTATGCSREKVGRLIQLIGRTFGIDIKGMSRRTVSRVIIEGWVASKVQLAHEIKNSEGVTISQDSTSHRKQNYESHHIIPKVPDYDELKQLQDSGDKAKPIYKPRTRFVSLDATLDHSSQGSIDSWKVINNELSELFNRSPFARRLNQKFTIRDFLLALKGMCAEIVFYLAAWNTKKLEEVGGIDAWNCLSPREQAVKDSSIAQRLITELGQAEYDSLGVDERREIDLFIWSGCCMHKDLNSFKGGNSEMMGEWERLGVDRPVLLANKGNAAILQRVLDPGANFGKLTEDQQRAFLESTRGGVKAMDLMGALLNNKDDKKGQGDIHVDYFKKHLGKDHPRFPPTNNTRFSSHGLAAAEVIKYLSLYRKFINEGIPYSKTHPTCTNLEVNIARALSDDATITELCAMVVYMNTISQPYLRVV